jgi:hypothetical protein
MGGIARILGAAFGSKPRKAAAPVVSQAAQPAAQAQITPTTPSTTPSMIAAGSGYGGGTIMTGAGGVETEANISRTMLGGGSTVERRKRT